MSKFISGTWSSMAVGLLAAVLLDSSSAVIIITIILVNSKLFTLRQAMGIVLGANIGTTMSSQIIATNMNHFSSLLMLSVFIASIISRNKLISSTGEIIFFFGLLFFGLFTMEKASEPLKQNVVFSS